MEWIRGFWKDLLDQGRVGFGLLIRGGNADYRGLHVFHSVAALLCASLVAGGFQFIDWDPELEVVKGELHLVLGPPRPAFDLARPVREIPKRFPARSYLPRKREGAASVSIDHVSFDPATDLVAVYDDRVWWESDHDVGDTEDDHLVHHALEIPLRRLIELVSSEGGILEVQDSYRDQGIHAPRSLHRQGRAVDLTCDELGLQRLAQLTWAAGFDWVYYEAPRRGGHHVHASVRP